VCCRAGDARENQLNCRSQHAQRPLPLRGLSHGPENIRSVERRHLRASSLASSIADLHGLASCDRRLDGTDVAELARPRRCGRLGVFRNKPRYAPTALNWSLTFVDSTSDRARRPLMRRRAGRCLVVGPTSIERTGGAGHATNRAAIINPRMTRVRPHVGFTPGSRHQSGRSACPLCASGRNRSRGRAPRQPARPRR